MCYFVDKERFGVMGKHSQFPTPIQNIALHLIFAVMGEDRINRTYDEYMAIAARLPPLKELTFKVNRMLQELHKCNGCDGVFLPPSLSLSPASSTAATV
jgi:hypothetical protein